MQRDFVEITCPRSVKLTAMKLLALIGSVGVLAGAFAKQAAAPDLPAPLASDLTKLSTATSLKAHFTKRIVGEAPTAFSLEMTKDKKFKLSWDTGFVISDGTSVYTYKKTGNTYTQVDTGDKSIEKFRKRTELLGWEAFLQAKPGSDIVSATAGADRTVGGITVNTFDVTYKPGNRMATLFVDPKLGVTTGFSYKVKDKEYLVLADMIDVSSNPLPDKDFAFVAPDGATRVKDSGGDFASVQQLLNDSCMPCHSSDHKRAGVDLSNFDGIAAIVKPSDSAGSLLIKAVKGDGVDLMPKGHAPLSDDQIASLAAWIDAGAKNE
jgi:outer membrane lipoprotein-sorting protein